MIESTIGRANHEELNQIGESAMTKIFGGSQILQPDFMEGNQTLKLAQMQISGKQQVPLPASEKKRNFFESTKNAHSPNNRDITQVQVTQTRRNS